MMFWMLLGTKSTGSFSSWDGRYKLELKNYEEYCDEGEVWFGKAAESRMVKYLASLKLPFTARIVDLGCGNGSLLRHLVSLRVF